MFTVELSYDCPLCSHGQWVVEINPDTGKVVSTWTDGCTPKCVNLYANGGHETVIQQALDSYREAAFERAMSRTGESVNGPADALHSLRDAARLK